MHIRSWLIGLLLVEALMTAQAGAFTLAPFNVHQMTRQAEKIFVGKCIAVEKSMNEYGLSVLTVTFAVQDAIKGDVGQTVTFRQLNPVQPPPPRPGVGGLRTDIATFSLPSYPKGEEVVIFLAKAGRIGLTSPLGLVQGKMPVSTASDGTKQVTNTALREEPAQNPAIPLPGQVGNCARFVATLRTMVQTGK